MDSSRQAITCAESGSIFLFCTSCAETRKRTIVSLHLPFGKQGYHGWTLFQPGLDGWNLYLLYQLSTWIVEVRSTFSCTLPVFLYLFQRRNCTSFHVRSGCIFYITFSVLSQKSVQKFDVMFSVLVLYIMRKVYHPNTTCRTERHSSSSRDGVSFPDWHTDLKWLWRDCFATYASSIKVSLHLS